MAAHLFRKMFQNPSPKLVKFCINLWPPYFGAGINIVEISEDYHYAKVRLKKSWTNMNYVGTQFGGSIYAMTDPFYMFLLIHVLGKEYIVWDKGAEIDFKKPGRSHLYAEFQLTPEIIQDIKEKTSSGDKYIFTLPVSVVDPDGNEIAHVDKVLYVRKKN